MDLPIDSLDLGAFTPRLAIDHGYVKKLAADIEQNDLQRPVLVRPHPKTSDRWEVIDGNHRVEACKLAGLDVVRVEVRPLSDEDAAFLAMHSNLWRGKGLTPLEQGRQLWRLQHDFQLSQAEIGQKFRRSQQWVSERINLWLKSSSALKESVTARAVTFSHARSIAQLPELDQNKVLEKVQEQKLDARQTAIIIHRLKRAETNQEKQGVLSETPLKSPFLGAQTKEELQTLQNSAPMIESFPCPHCGNPILVNFVTREIAKTEVGQ